VPKTRRLLTNFSKGELSPLVEGRPDLAAYFEGGRTVENFSLLRQGGLTRRPGTQFVKEVKDSTKDTILIPFEFSVNDSYMLEFGPLYIRVYKNKAPVLVSAGGPQVEIVTPYTEADLRTIHVTQSADVLFLFCPGHAQRKLSRVSDTSWTLSTTTYTPPPSFEADADISGGTATLTLAATTGTSVIATASSAVFLQGDVGRQLIIGAGRAVIAAFGSSAGDTGSPNDQVRVDVLDAFASVGPHAAGTWFLRLSPQTTLDPDIRAPIGAVVTFAAGTPAFRAADVGKFVKIYGGVIRLTAVTSATSVKGTLQSVMGDTTDANPPAAPAGAWTLEEASWSTTRGFPRTGEFLQGRLVQASATAQPTTWWGSASDSFDNYAVGTFADDAIEYTIASRQVNRIEWLADNIDLFIGTAGAELRVQGERNGEPLGGDVIPLVERLTPHGCAPIQPVVLARKTLFVDRSQTKVFLMAFDLAQEGFDAAELTDIAEHVTGTGLRTGPLGYRKRLDPTVYFVRTDGQLVALTYLPLQRVVGFTRYVTDGTFEAVSVIPRPAGQADQVWVIVKRTIGGTPKRYVEVFEETVSGLTGRAWASLQTDSAVIYDGAATTTISVPHLTGKTVDVIAGASVKGTKVVTAGVVTLDEAASEVEVGLHYDATLTTMRPAVEGEVLEGLPRSWDSLWVRLKDTIGGRVNSQDLQYVPSDLDELGLFTGDRKITGQDWDTEGRITVQQTQPYPMTVLAVFGTLSVGDHD
jgi:hypothetical protein